MTDRHANTAVPLLTLLLFITTLLIPSDNVQNIGVCAFALHHPVGINNNIGIITTRPTGSKLIGIHSTNQFTLPTTAHESRSHHDRLKLLEPSYRRLQLLALAHQRHFSHADQIIQPKQQHDASSIRRSFVSHCFSVAGLLVLSPVLADSAVAETTTMVDLPSDKPIDNIVLGEKDVVGVGERQVAFHSAAYGLEEYNNAIVASRDTNISPKEVYDTISSDYLRGAYDAAINKDVVNSSSSSSSKSRRKQGIFSPRALDVGAGAGVSTEILYKMGFHTIDALDWSGKAWERYVVEDPMGVCPPSVQFYELDDERYLESWRKEYYGDGTSGNEEDEGNGLYDAIVFNFAINESKARTFATELLNKDHGVLLAPINISTDYWLKQRYKVMDASGGVLWSTEDVGAWSVLFQPDVTQDTCQGIWCSPYNGFQKKK